MKKLFLLTAVFLLAACAPAVPPEIEITPVPAPLVGRPAPDFSWTVESVLKTEEQKLSEFRGQVVLLVFWSPYCSHCLDEMPILKALDERYGEDLVVISITTDASGAWQKAKEEVGFDFLVLVNPQGGIFNEYWIRGVPALFVIDQEGVIQARFDGAVPESQIEDELAPLLGEK